MAEPPAQPPIPSLSLFTAATSAVNTPFDSNANVPLNPDAEPTSAAKKRTSKGGRRDVPPEDINKKRANVKESFFGWRT
jgi:hypothetical protein